jgi:hypothetical protein
MHPPAFSETGISIALSLIILFSLLIGEMTGRLKIKNSANN